MYVNNYSLYGMLSGFLDPMFSYYGIYNQWCIATGYHSDYQTFLQPLNPSLCPCNSKLSVIKQDECPPEIVNGCVNKLRNKYTNLVLHELNWRQFSASCVR